MVVFHLVFTRDCDGFLLSAPFQESMLFSPIEKDYERMHESSVSDAEEDREVRMDLTDDLLHMVCVAVVFISSSSLFCSYWYYELMVIVLTC